MQQNQIVSDSVAMGAFPAMNAQLVNVQPAVSVPSTMAQDLTQAEQTMLTNIQWVAIFANQVYSI